MKIIENLCNNLIIIVPNNLKEQIVKEISLQDKIYSYKLITETELKKSLFFDYDYKAIVYLKEKCHINVSIALEYIEAMYYIEDIVYKDPLLNELKQLKNELLEKELLKVDKYFHKILIGKKIIVYGFDIINKELERMLSKLNHNYEVIVEDYGQLKTKSIYKFLTMQEEVEGVCKMISSLLCNNVNINNIKIANVDNDYLFTFKRYAKMYNLAIDFSLKTPLYSLVCIKEFIKDLDDKKDINEALISFKEKNINEQDLYKSLVNVFNSLVDIDIFENKDILIYVLKHTYLTNKKYNNVIEIIDLNNVYLNDNDYLFVLSLNQNIYPKTYKNEELLSDTSKDELNISTSEEKNIFEKLKFEILLKKCQNIVLSYKLKSPFKEYNKAFVLDELSIKDIEFSSDYHISYSKMADMLLLADIYDKIYENETRKEICVLANNYDLKYKTYCNKFLKFNSQKIKDFIIKNNIKLSYSAISNYFLCNFKYYLENLLKIKANDVTTATDIGNVYHAILEKSYQNNFDYEEEFNKQISTIEDIKTRFYINKYKGLMKDIVSIIQKNIEKSDLKNVLTEKEIVIKYTYPISITFKGYLDKIFYEIKDDKTYVAIVDYKTGDVEIDVNKVKFGLSMQLPIYLYLLKHTTEFKNVVICGFYLQKIIPKQLTNNDDYYKNLNDSIALQGYSNSSFEILSHFDPSFASSTMIKNMKLTAKQDFYKYSKVLSSKQMDEISNEVEEKIKEALIDICSCKFDINPKILNDKNISCTYCDFKDCCFVNFKDYIYLKDDANSNEMAGDN